ncbi:hypothetical protein AUP68_13271 [Ilyonectria robusta]
MHQPQSEPLQLDVAVMHSFEVLRGRVSYVVARLATDSCLATSRYHLSPLFTRRRKAQHIYKQLRPSIAPLSSSATSDSFPRELRHAQVQRVDVLALAAVVAHLSCSQDSIDSSLPFRRVTFKTKLDRGLQSAPRLDKEEPQTTKDQKSATPFRLLQCLLE